MKLTKTKSNRSLGLISLVIALSYFIFSQLAFGQVETLGDMADSIVGSFRSIGKLMVAAAYIGGFSLTIASIFKFKQHKDNPQQVPMGAPIALLAIGVLLVFLPSLFNPAGETVFGGNQEAGGFEGQGAEKIGN